MNRIKPPTNGATGLTRTPPSDALPESITKLLAEHARLVTEHSTAATEDAHLRINATAFDNAARAADAAAAAAAARTGGDVTARPNADALTARRQEVAQRTGALSDALEIVAREVSNARSEWQQSGQPAKKVAAASAKLAKAGEAFARALAEVAQAVAVAEWVDGEPYDDTPLVPLVELDPALSTLLGARGNDLPAGINAAAAIGAIVATFSQEPAHV